MDEEGGAAALAGALASLDLTAAADESEVAQHAPAPAPAIKAETEVVQPDDLYSRMQAAQLSTAKSWATPKAGTMKAVFSASSAVQDDMYGDSDED